MQIEQLNILLEVVQKGSFVAVANAREVNSSSISRSIQALEKQLGFRVLQRTTRNLSLTEAGEVYVQSIRPLMDQLEQAQIRALDTKQALQGILRVTLPLGFGEAKVIPLLPRFKQAYPHLKLELLITDECLDLEKERIDVGVRLGEVTEGNWVAKPLIALGMIVCASPEFCKGYELSSPASLEHVPCLNFIRQAGAVIWHFEDKTSTIKLEVAIQEDCLATTARAVKNLCLLNQGVAMLPDWLVDKEIKNGRLVELFPEFKAGFSENADKAWCVYPSREYVPAKTRTFIDFLIAEMAESC